MYALFYDVPTTHDESQKESRVEGVSAISEGQDFNTAIMKEAVVELHSAHMEFASLQLK